jgi:hypothetical protein
MAGPFPDPFPIGPEVSIQEASRGAGRYCLKGWEEFETWADNNIGLFRNARRYCESPGWMHEPDKLRYLCFILFREMQATRKREWERVNGFPVPKTPEII